MKTVTEFVEWLDVEGRHAEIVVNWDDFSFLVNRLHSSARIEDAVVMVSGRRIRGIPPPVPALSSEPLDVSDRRLFE